MNPITRSIELSTALCHVQKECGWRGVLIAIANKLTGSSRLVPLNARPDFFVRPGGSDLSACNQVFNEQEYHYEAPRTVRTIIDAGSNVGCSAVHFATAFPDAKILCIEAAAENFSIRESNTSRFPAIECLHAALWTSNVELSVVDEGGGAWALRVVEQNLAATNRKETEAVTGITLGEVRTRWHMPEVDILKVDIEGGEREVFAEGPSLLEGVNVLIIETHDRLVPGCTRVIREATRGFDYTWNQAENVFFCREGWLPVHFQEEDYSRISPARSVS